MSKEGAMFQETVKLTDAARHSFISREFLAQRRWGILLLGVTYAIVVALLPLAVISDFCRLLPYGTHAAQTDDSPPSEKSGEIKGESN
ncbi:hypothetical protein [Natronococcus amylolyticus]|nr:hypothetical protein [Natronococcus amylolyticus]